MIRSHAISAVLTAIFVALAAGSDGSGKDNGSEEASRQEGGKSGKGKGVGESEVKVTEEAQSAKMECKEDVSGKLGGMLKDLVDEHDKKTDLQKEAFKQKASQDWAEKGYCGKISGEVEDVGIGVTGSSVMSGCDAPDQLDGYLTVENLDGVNYRSAIVFAPEDKVKSDFAELSKGSQVELEIYAYDVSLLLNGTVCGVLK